MKYDFVVGLGKNGKVVLLGGRTTTSNWKKHFAQLKEALQ